MDSVLEVQSSTNVTAGRLQAGTAACLASWRKVAGDGIMPGDVRYTEEGDESCFCECSGGACFACTSGGPPLREQSGGFACRVASTATETQSLPPVRCDAGEEEDTSTDEVLLCRREEDVCPPFLPAETGGIVEYKRLDHPTSKCFCIRRAACTDAEGVLKQTVEGWSCPGRSQRVTTFAKEPAACHQPATQTGDFPQRRCRLPTSCLPKVSLPPELVACGPQEPHNLRRFFQGLQPVLLGERGPLRSCLVTCTTVFSKLAECNEGSGACAGTQDKLRVLRSKVNKINGKVRVIQGSPCAEMYHSSMGLATEYQEVLLQFAATLADNEGKALQLVSGLKGKAASVERAFKDADAQAQWFGGITCGKDGKTGWCPNALRGHKPGVAFGIDECTSRCRGDYGSALQLSELSVGPRGHLAKPAPYRKANSSRAYTQAVQTKTGSLAVQRKERGSPPVQRMEARPPVPKRKVRSHAPAAPAKAQSPQPLNRPKVCRNKYVGREIAAHRNGSKCYCACVGADCMACPPKFQDVGSECVLYADEEKDIHVDTKIGFVCPNHYSVRESEDGQVLCVASGKCSAMTPTEIGHPRYAEIRHVAMSGNCGCTYQIVCTTGVLIKKDGEWFCRDTSRAVDRVERERRPKACAGLEVSEQRDEAGGGCRVEVPCPAAITLRLGPLACGPRFPEHQAKFLPEAVHAMLTHPKHAECLSRCWSIHAKVAECVANDLSRFECTGMAGGSSSKASDAFAMQRHLLSQGLGTKFSYPQIRTRLKEAWPAIPERFEDAQRLLADAEATMKNVDEVKTWAMHRTSKKGSCRDLFPSNEVRTAAANQESFGAAVGMIREAADFELQAINVAEDGNRDLHSTSLAKVLGAISCDGDCKTVLENKWRSADIASCIAVCRR